MEDSTLLDELRRRVGYDLRPLGFSLRELRMLEEQSRSCSQCAAGIRSIPLAEREVADPRLLSSTYLSRLAVANPPRAHTLSRQFRKLPLILALEDTLVHAIPVPTDHNPLELCSSVQLLCGDALTVKPIAGVGRWYIVIERPGALSFLQSLQPFYQCHLVTAMEETAAKEVVTAWGWDACLLSVTVRTGNLKVKNDFLQYSDTKFLVILDARGELWGEDRLSVFPTLLFRVDLGSLSLWKTDTESSTYVYSFTPGKSLEADQRKAAKSFLETQHRQQLPALSRCLLDAAKFYQFNQYSTDTVTALRRAAYAGRDLQSTFINLHRKEEAGVLSYMVKYMGGTITPDINTARVVVVPDDATEVFGAKRTLRASDLYRFYFLA